MATLWDPAERHGHLGPLPGQRLVLVTGAARGLGVGICKQVPRAGWAVGSLYSLYRYPLVNIQKTMEKYHF